MGRKKRGGMKKKPEERGGMNKKPEQTKPNQATAEATPIEQKKKPKIEASSHNNHTSSSRYSSLWDSVAPPVQSSKPPRVPKEPGLDRSQYPPTKPIEMIVSNILKNPPRMGVENALNELRLGVSNQFVEDVLKLSYGAGMEAVKFFRWAGLKLTRKHSPLAWNLLVDLLGKEKLFDAMWDCIKVMKNEGTVSMEIFSSVFGNYVQAGKLDEAKMTFEVMEQYGCRHDVVALNCYISALCRYKQAKAALEFFDRVKARIAPDADTYALLLEGWEIEGNVSMAKTTFGEMIVHLGWVPNNTSAYNAFLSTLVNGFQVEEALKFLVMMKSLKCLPDLGFFRNTLQILYQRKDTKNAYGLWELMRQSGIVPDLPTYNTMIGVCCSVNPIQVDFADRLLVEMVCNGAFPDFRSYNTIFEALIIARKVEEASSIFREMTKNEFCPLYANYVRAIKMYFEAEDPDMAVIMWKHMIQKAIFPKSDCAATLIDGFCDLGRVSEALKYSLEAINRGVEIPVETMTKLKNARQAGRQDAYGQLEKKMKSVSN
jgi:pentatricopeptide repeat protein